MNRNLTDTTCIKFTAKAGTILAVGIDEVTERYNEKTAKNTEADR
jgi:hypothetical protein